MDLDSMKYAELRSLAKELGLKANLKADKLLKAIKQHYEGEKKKEQEAKEQNSDTVQEAAAAESVQTEQDDACQEAPNTTLFVNTRRGRGNCTKRTISSGASEVDGPSELCNPPCSAGDKKKRKVSPDRDSKMTELEPQPAVRDQQQRNSRKQPPLHAETEKAPKVVKVGRIPRYQGLQQKSKTLLKPTTPNFQKLHEAQFNKMESIDSYVQRKKKQVETYKTPIKDLKKNLGQASIFSPVPVKKTPAEEKHQHTLPLVSKIPSKKPAGKEDVLFRPTVLSTRRINVRFSEATLDNEFKRSLVKTPARISLSVTSSTPKKTAADTGKPATVKTSGFSAQKTPGPFVFTGNTSGVATPGTQKKPAFDLKASLSRPLTYKPHKGKLKPFGEVKENAAGNVSVSNPRQESYKQPKILSREDRRNKQQENRKQKKESMLGARRGLVMM